MSAAVNLLYFARVAELVGKRTEAWPLAADTTGGHLLAELRARYPRLAEARRLRLAVNQEHATPTARVQPGDEVAIFEPVTGG
ncbi:MAG TPA: molybdopterin converting factor subunit 1 [Bordetella sp.]